MTKSTVKKQAFYEKPESKLGDVSAEIGLWPSRPRQEEPRFLCLVGSPVVAGHVWPRTGVLTSDGERPSGLRGDCSATGSFPDFLAVAYLSTCHGFNLQLAVITHAFGSVRQKERYVIPEVAR